MRRYDRLVQAINDRVVLRVPVETFSESQLTGLQSSGIVAHSLRGGGVGSVVTIVLDAVGVTSGLVTLVIARDELVAFASRFVASLRRLAPGDKVEKQLHLELTSRGKSVHISLEAEDSSDTFARAVLRLVESGEAEDASG